MICEIFDSRSPSLSFELVTDFLLMRLMLAAWHIFSWKSITLTVAVFHLLSSSTKVLRNGTRRFDRNFMGKVCQANSQLCNVQVLETATEGSLPLIAETGKKYSALASTGKGAALWFASFHSSLRFIHVELSHPHTITIHTRLWPGTQVWTGSEGLKNSFLPKTTAQTGCNAGNLAHCVPALDVWQFDDHYTVLYCRLQVEACTPSNIPFPTCPDCSKSFPILRDKISYPRPAVAIACFSISYLFCLVAELEAMPIHICSINVLLLCINCLGAGRKKCCPRPFLTCKSNNVLIIRPYANHINPSPSVL